MLPSSEFGDRVIQKIPHFRAARQTRRNAATGIDFLTGGALIEKKCSLYIKPGISLYGGDGFARGIRGTTGEEKEGKGLRTEFRA
jgi:hypothetical protein